MALIKCSECGKEFSDKADRCPNCGCPMTEILKAGQQGNPVIINSNIQGKVNTPVMPEKLPFYQQTGFILAMLVCCCFPVGLFLMWRYKKFNKPIRIIISAFFAIMFISVVVSGGKGGEGSGAAPSKRQASETAIETTVKATTEPETTTAALSPQEEFEEMFCSATGFTKETADKVYDLLVIQMGFEGVKSVAKNPVAQINFDINAGGYKIMLTVDDDGIYRAICGDYVLYEDGGIVNTKQNLDDRRIDSGDQAYYYTIAEEIVSKALKNPKGAKFAGIYEAKMGRNGEYVVVQAYVDATNSFNAVIRTDFTVEFRVIDLKSFSYEVVYLNLGGETAGTYIDIK